MNILWINGCMRRSGQSRTEKISRQFISKLKREEDLLVEENLTSAKFLPMTENDINVRDNLLSAGLYNDSEFDAAHRLINADCIVISVPYWDFSFPAEFKCYIEHICVNGITFKCDENGGFTGLCKAKKLYYITTAGGCTDEFEYGFGYVKSLFGKMLGVKNAELIQANGLDIAGNDPDEIISAVELKI